MKTRQNINFFENFVSQRLTNAQLLAVKGGDNEPPNPPGQDPSFPGPHAPKPK